ncbi:MAG: hypothetical protein ACREEC_00195, partial [Thermoplasmata archaeon]
HLRIDISTDLHSAAVDHVLPRPLTLRGLVADLTRAYYSAFWAEEPGWLAQRWSWLHHRDERRAARDFVRVTHALSLALPALEAK